MILTDITPVPDSALPLAAFKAHLRLGTGFGEDSLQDEVLLAFLRASLAAIETRLSKVLLRRDFEWRLSDWGRLEGQGAASLRLPVAPVLAVASLTLEDAQGTQTPQAMTGYVLQQDSHAPRLTALSGTWPVLRTGDAAVVRMTAGMAASWDDLPADLAQAVFLLAAHYYEYRSDTTLHAGCLPFGVASLIDRHRVARLGLGQPS